MNDESRASRPAPAVVPTTASNVHPTTDALWTLAEECPADSLRWFGIGWQLGCLDGSLMHRATFDDGYAAAERDMAASWHQVYLDVQAAARRPTFAELKRRRGEVA